MVLSFWDEYLYFAVLILLFLVLVIANAVYNKNRYVIMKNRLAQRLRSIKGGKVISNLLFAIDNKPIEIDHLVITRYGIFVIDVKIDDGVISGSEEEDLWIQYIKRGKRDYEFANPIKQNKRRIGYLKHLLGKYPHLKIQSLIVYILRCKLKVESKVPVIGIRHVKKQIASFTEENLTEKETTSIFEYLLEIKQIKQFDTNVLKKRPYRLMNSKNQYICPRCGKELIVLNGKHGIYYGCSNAPRCTFQHKDY